MIPNLFCINPAFNLWVTDKSKTVYLTVNINYENTVQISLTKAHALALMKEIGLALKELERVTSTE